MKSTLLAKKNEDLTFIILILIVLFAGIAAQAQKPRFGIKIGTSISNLTIKSAEPEIETTTKAGISGGLFVHFRLCKRLAIRPGVEFINKGAQLNKTYNSNYTYSIRQNIRLSYLDLPVNLLYDIPFGQNKLFIGGGPVASFLLNRKYSQGVSANDLGINVLTGFEWPFGAAFMINYTHGLKNVSTSANKETAIKNYYLGITLGYWF
jgi:hypothetical protein